MRCCSGLQCLHQTQLCARSKVRVDVRTLLRTVSKLRLYSLTLLVSPTWIRIAELVRRKQGGPYTTGRMG